MSALLKREWFLGGLAGVVATIIGFSLAMFWDVHKMRVEGEERDQAILWAISEEMKANDAAIQRNVSILQQELPLLREKRVVVLPLSLLQAGAWDVAKISNPHRLMTVDTLAKLREVIKLADQVNEAIWSREFYRTSNSVADNYADRLGVYDRLLLDSHAQL
jgi:hypothetical protein